MAKESGSTYSGLEVGNLLVGEGIRLGDDGDQVDLGVEAAHDLDVEGLEGVTGGLDEEDTGVNSVVNNVHAVDLVLGIEVGVESLLNVVDDGSPRLVVVDEVAESRSVNNGQAETDTGLLNVGADGLDGNGLGNDVQGRALALLGGVQGGVEEGVDEGRLAQARFTCKKQIRSGGVKLRQYMIPHTNDHNIEVEALAHTLAVPLVGQVGKADIAGQLSSDNVSVVSDRGRRLAGNCDSVRRCLANLR